MRLVITTIFTTATTIFFSSSSLPPSTSRRIVWRAQYYNYPLHRPTRPSYATNIYRPRYARTHGRHGIFTERFRTPRGTTEKVTIFGISAFWFTFRPSPSPSPSHSHPSCSSSTSTHNRIRPKNENIASTRFTARPTIVFCFSEIENKTGLHGRVKSAYTLCFKPAPRTR